MSYRSRWTEQPPPETLWWICITGRGRSGWSGRGKNLGEAFIDALRRHPEARTLPEFVRGWNMRDGPENEWWLWVPTALVAAGMMDEKVKLALLRKLEG